MKKINVFWILICLFLLSACDPNDYASDLYVQPEASFEIPKTDYDVFESVIFTNKGSGQYFVVYPGDKNHRYGLSGNTGFSTNTNGTFSYSYSDPGTYTAVWVASSTNVKGEKEISIDSVTVTVVARNGGLDRFSIYNIYRLDEYQTGGLSIYYTSYGEFISPDTLICPILYSSWKDAAFNSIKASQYADFELSSNNAEMYWVNLLGEEIKITPKSTASRILYFVENGKLKTQNFRVKTASGFISDYYMAPVMIPQFTKFSINGVDGTITRNISDFYVYDVELTLPSGTDLQGVKPEFVVMNNDTNLLDGTNCKVTINGIEQISGTSVVNFSNKGEAEYKIDYWIMDGNSANLMQQSTIRVKVTN